MTQRQNKLIACNTCGIEKDISMYHTAGVKNGKRYYRRKCSKCYMDVKNKYRRANSEWFKNYKRALKCNSCGYSKNTHDNFTEKALEFHHINNDKLFNISDAVFFCGRDKVLEEISKCIVLCSRCHTEEHYKKLI
tara:strand:- start:930 stop:1334 length:405 start_codon:yes stop_codon:yes gene_type:complete